MPRALVAMSSTSTTSGVIHPCSPFRCVLRSVECWCSIDKKSQIMLFYSATILSINIWRNMIAHNEEQVKKDMGNVKKCTDVLRIHEKR